MHLLQLSDFTQLANFFYATIGIEPYNIIDDERKKSLPARILNNIIFYSALININIMLLAEVIFVLMAFVNGNNFVEATMTMSYIGFVVVGDFKMLSVWWKKCVLTKFIHELVQMFPQTSTQQMHYDMDKYLRQYTWVTRIFVLLYMILVWTYNLFAITQYLIYERWLQVRVIGQILPYRMYIPWQWQDNWSYYLVYVLQGFAAFTAAAGQISSDLLLCATATLLIMHYDYVARSIQAYEITAITVAGADAACELTAKQSCLKDFEFLHSIIAYHDKILSLSDMMNDVFGVPLLFNFMTSSFVICFVGFQMTIGVQADTLIKLSLFLFSSIAQVYLICHYGQLLIDASVNIALAVYSHQWFNADVRYQKMLVLIVERAQKPAFLKATSFVKISRNTMTDIMQMSYKFFALLRTMYSK